MKTSYFKCETASIIKGFKNLNSEPRLSVFKTLHYKSWEKEKTFADNNGSIFGSIRPVRVRGVWHTLRRSHVNWNLSFYWPAASQRVRKCAHTLTHRMKKQKKLNSTGSSRAQTAAKLFCFYGDLAAHSWLRQEYTQTDRRTQTNTDTYTHTWQCVWTDGWTEGHVWEGEQEGREGKEGEVK